ncbi:MAG: peptidyl-prolyl cis-trans isomerase [Clostridia bacterium]|nr:peptidyl-prolyl cis-trans isomerase [Clostridia bacterium]
MHKQIVKWIGLCLALCMVWSAAVPAFAAGLTEAGTEAAPTSEIAGDGGYTAADARAMGSAADARRVLRAAVGDTSAEDDALHTAGIGMNDRILTASGEGFSAAEYIYFYTSVYFSYYQQSYYYDYYYGEGYGKALTGFDYTLSPDAQTLTAADGTTVTYAQYFDDMTKATMEQYAYYNMQAKANSLTLDETDEAEIADSMQSLADAAADYGTDIDAFTEMQYDKGVNAYTLAHIMRKQLLAKKYQEFAQADIAASITDADLEAQYQANAADYDTISARVFRLPITAGADDAQPDAAAQQAAAEAFMKKVTDEASFAALAAQTDPVNFSGDASTVVPDAQYDTIARYISADAADWCFSADRKVGDMNVFSAAQYVYVLYITSPVGRNEDRLPSVRHILVSFDDAAGEEGVTTAADARSRDEAKALAEQYLAEYKKGEKTEESFAALAEQYSDDTASLAIGGQGMEGGLYENIAKGAYVPAFENWAYDAAREIGDTEIIETEYGYHVMYFVGRAEEPAWKAEIRAVLTEEQTEGFFKSLTEEYADTAVYDPAVLTVVLKHTVAQLASLMS